ncbi:MAG: hypothetical protein ACLT8E_01575 [Akkermansia sp.]
MQKLADVCEALTGYGRSRPRRPPPSSGPPRAFSARLRHCPDAPAKVQKAGLGAPAVVVIGDVVKERDSLAWFEKLPCSASASW